MATNGGQPPQADLERLTQAVQEQAYGDELPDGKAQSLQKALAMLWSDAFRETVSPIFGDRFLDIVKVAPAEFAATTLLVHMFVALPISLMENAVDHGVQWAGLECVDELEVSGKKILTRLAASLASANQHECEYRVMKATSWHEVAFNYAVSAYRIVRSGLDSGYQKGVKESKQRGAAREFEKLLGKDPKRKKRRVSETWLQKYWPRIAACWTAERDLESQGLAMSDEELTGLAIRMQQELPRAWAFKYGPGNTGFQTLDDAVFAIIESCVDPSRACATRDAYFDKRNREELGPTKIAKEWNAKSKAERQQIAPRATGNVSPSAVKKAIQRRRRAGSREKR